MKDLIIVGAGGFGRELLQWVKDINRKEEKWNILGFIDDNLKALDGYECEYPILGTIQECRPKDNHAFAIAIADPRIKEDVVKRLKSAGAIFTSVIHPTAYISDNAEIGEGLVMYPNSGINANAKVGDYVTLLPSQIGHDAEVASYCTICSYCDITGGVKLEERVFLGSHTTIVPKRRIGTDAYIGAGSVVVTDVKDGVRVMGNPAKRVGF